MYMKKQVCHVSDLKLLKLKSRELKPRIINQQCVVYRIKCGLCNMDYVEYTNRHFHQRVTELSWQAHVYDMHGIRKPNLTNNFSVLKKCRNKFDCLIYEMLIIRDVKPGFNHKESKCLLYCFHLFIFNKKQPLRP